MFDLLLAVLFVRDDVVEGGEGVEEQVLDPLCPAAPQGPAHHGAHDLGDLEGQRQRVQVQHNSEDDKGIFQRLNTGIYYLPPPPKKKERKRNAFSQITK